MVIKVMHICWDPVEHINKSSSLLWKTVNHFLNSHTKLCMLSATLQFGKENKYFEFKSIITQLPVYKGMVGVQVRA